MEITESEHVTPTTGGVTEGAVEAEQKYQTHIENSEVRPGIIDLRSLAPHICDLLHRTSVLKSNKKTRHDYTKTRIHNSYIKHVIIIGTFLRLITNWRDHP